MQGGGGMYAVVSRRVHAAAHARTPQELAQHCCCSKQLGRLMLAHLGGVGAPQNAYDRQVAVHEISIRHVCNACCTVSPPATGYHTCLAVQPKPAMPHGPPACLPDVAVSEAVQRHINNNNNNNTLLPISATRPPTHTEG